MDYARGHHAAKRGGSEPKVPVEQAPVLSKERAGYVVALDEALTCLAEIDAQHHRIVELRYVGGFTVEETAEVLGISPATVKRDWNLTRAWLTCEMRGKSDS